MFGPTLSSLTCPCISLESHVQMLQDSNQAIPQPVAMLLAEARRKEEKRTAKRVANRKSACTSRARKKALVEEMTRTNARLKRQAMILALLPDLVIAITIDGEITFCSAQVSCIYDDNMRCWIHFIVFLMCCCLPGGKSPATQGKGPRWS